MGCSGLNKKYNVNHVSRLPQVDLQGVHLKAQKEHEHQLSRPGKGLP